MHLQEENNKLKQEVEELRKQQKQNNKTFVNSPPSPPHISSLATKEISNNHDYYKSGNSQQRLSNQTKAPVPQNQSPDSRYLIIPNVNKDAPPSSSSGSPKTWQDSRVRVQTTFVPEFNLNKHLFEDKPEYSYFNSIACNQPTSRANPFDAGFKDNGQMAQSAYILLTAVVQQIMVSFFETVCAAPQQEMVSALSPNVISSPDAVTENQPVKNEMNEEVISSPDAMTENKLVDDEVNEEIISSPEVNEEEPLLEFAEEASVLDWLYDSMVNHVVEQSQMEARIMELSDWVGEEWDDNVLPFLF